MPHSNKILIMDKDPDILLFCTLVFQRRGYEVCSSFGCSPNDFLKLLADFTTSLIFVDHSMRKSSALKTIHTLRSHLQYADIPVVVFSAEENIAAFAKEEVANAYLKKPFTIQRLLDVTRRFIS